MSAFRSIQNCDALADVCKDLRFPPQSEWDDELDGLSESTRKDVRQVVFRMLREAEILSSGDLISPTILSAEAGRVIWADDPALFTISPISDLDL